MPAKVGCGTAFYGAEKNSTTAKVIQLYLQNLLQEAEPMIPSGPMDLIIQGHLFLAHARIPIQVRGLQPSTPFLHSANSMERTSLLLAVSARPQAREKPKPPPPCYKSTASVCHSCFSHLDETALKVLQLAPAPQHLLILLMPGRREVWQSR